MDCFVQIQWPLVLNSVDWLMDQLLAQDRQLRKWRPRTLITKPATEIIEEALPLLRGAHEDLSGAVHFVYGYSHILENASQVDTLLDFRGLVRKYLCFGELAAQPSTVDDGYATL